MATMTETLGSIDAGYFNRDVPDAPLCVRMHRDAIDGIARDMREGAHGQSGGLLLGHVAPGERPVVWIDRYQRIAEPFEPGEEFFAAFQRAAAEVAEGSDLSVVGLYRRQTGDRLELDAADAELIARYFNDATDIALLIGARTRDGLSARFFAHPAAGDVQPLGEAFPFQGRVPAEPAPMAALPAGLPSTPLRRLVPDFAPADEAESPVPELFRDYRAPADTADTQASTRGGFFRKWWPLMGALLLVGGALAIVALQAGHGTASGTSSGGPAVAETGMAADHSIRPLGLYVDPAGQPWRISWNPGATALRGARSVDLFVRDGEDQNRIDLTQADRDSASYQYKPKGDDVTFRLEVTGGDGRLSAESFRVVKTAPAPTAPAAPAPAEAVKNLKPPHPIDRVPPVVPASIRPRIRGPIPIDVRVQVDTHGRVTDAEPVKKPHAGVESYLAGRAVDAARKWRFEPAQQDGKPVQGTDTIHFVFRR